jgi:hypothetical protein
LDKIKSVVWVIVYAAVLTAPLVLLFITGEAPHDFDGEKDYARPAFSLGGFFNGEFQTDFENWFSTKYPLRPQIVELYNTLEARQDEDGYRGTANVIVGDEGYLYENGYINEYYGYAAKYRDITDEWLMQKSAELLSIQQALNERGVAFSVVITPSKASSLPQFIPDWYNERYAAEAVPGYVRPYERFKNFINADGVNYVDSASVYAGLGLTETFPKTSTHWTKMAAFETARALLYEYQRQTGVSVRMLAYDNLLSGPEPPGFGNSETDIFGIVYAGRSNELANAVRDEAYYWPDVYVSGENLPGLGGVLIQGGSFADDIAYYLENYDIADGVTGIRYNNNNDMASLDFEAALDGVSYVIIEINEQFVHNIGGSGPVFGLPDFTAVNPAENIIEALQTYLLE